MVEVCPTIFANLCRVPGRRLLSPCKSSLREAVKSQYLGRGRVVGRVNQQVTYYVINTCDTTTTHVVYYVSVYSLTPGYTSPPAAVLSSCLSAPLTSPTTRRFRGMEPKVGVSAQGQSCLEASQSSKKVAEEEKRTQAMNL